MIRFETIHRWLLPLAVVVGLLIVCVPRDSSKAAANPIFNRAPLLPNVLAPLPLGSIEPRGWLRSQLQIQADGLTGHIDEFWPDLGPDSGWLGGDGEGWERGPYYLDGLVPLAYLLQDDGLIRKAQSWIDWTLENQRADGFIGPDPDSEKRAHYEDWHGTDWWPRMVMLKVLAQFHEATDDPRVLPVLRKYLLYHLKLAEESPLREWASMRWAEEALVIAWLYNRTGDKQLLRLAPILKSQAFDWQEHFADFQFPEKVRRDQADLSTHVVNNAMAMKTGAVWWQFSGEPTAHDYINAVLAALDAFHWQASGVHSGDEHYAGKDPSQGTELCAVVEGMYSYEQLLAILGQPRFGDRLERVAFNALPATFKPDMWAHQYDQQVNQVEASVNEQRNWTTNGPDSNIFGLEPNFGCCTANMHQGWPKFASHLWMATRDGGLAAVAYAPSRVRAVVAGNTEVSITSETAYPFADRIRMQVDPSVSASFPLKLRIPKWARNAAVTVNGQPAGSPPAESFHTVERRWKRGDLVELVLPMQVEAERHWRDAVALKRGPLVFSLAIDEDWRKVGGEEPHADWEVYPRSPWNFGLTLDPEDPSGDVAVEVRTVGVMPFSPAGAPVVLTAQGRRLPQWKLVHGSAGSLPASPTRSSQPLEKLRLIPYGSTNLRVTVFPVLESTPD